MTRDRGIEDAHVGDSVVTQADIPDLLFDRARSRVRHTSCRGVHRLQRQNYSLRVSL